MNFKEFYKHIYFDIDKSIHSLYSAKQGDTKSRGFYVTLLVNGAVMPVTDQSLTFYAEKPDKTRLLVEAIKDDDIFRVDLPNQAFAVAGVLKCELTLRGQDGEQISSKTFKMVVDSSIQDGSIVSKDERGILDRAFELAEDIIPRLELLDVELLEDVQDEMLGARHSNTKDESYDSLGQRLDAAEQDLLDHKAEYTSNRQQDQLKVAKVEKELNDYKATMQQVNINQEPKQKATGYGVISLPPNAANGQVSSRLLGQSVTNLLGGKGDNSWTLPARPNTGTAPIFFDNLNLPQDKYLIFYELMQTVETFDLNTPYYNIISVDYIDPDQKTKNNTVGRKVWKLDAPEIITKIGWRVYSTEAEVKVKNFMVVKATEEDWLLSEGELIQKYSFISGTKSTISAMRIKSVGKNLFEPTLNGWIKDAGGALTLNDSIFTYKRTSGGNFDEIYKFFKVIPNQPYTLQLNVLSIANAVRVRAYDKTIDGTLLKSNSFENIGLQTITFTPQTEDVVIAFGGSYANSECSFNFIQLEKGDQATDYEPYKESNAYIIAKDPEAGEILELRSLPNGTKDEINVSQKKLIRKIDDFILDGSLSWEYLSSKDNYKILRVTMPIEGSAGLESSRVWYKKAQLTYNTTLTVASLVVGEYFTLKSGEKFYFYIAIDDNDSEWIDHAPSAQEMKEFFNNHPITLTYQLAEPVEIPVQVSGTLTSYPNGTVYIEPFVADAGLYANKIEVLHQDLPIKEIEQLSKVDFMTGVEIPLDVSKVKIDENGLSFTHSELEAGDIVFFTYEYDREGTQGETEIEYYDSRYVVKDSVTDKFYKWDVTVADGVPSIALQEV